MSRDCNRGRLYLRKQQLNFDAVPTLFQGESLFYQRISATSRKTEKSPITQPCNSVSLQNLHKKEKCIQRLMPLFPKLKVYHHPFLHDLPRNLTIRKSTRTGAPYGVWSIEDIPIGTRYGPFDSVALLPNPKNKLRVQYFHRNDQQNDVEKPARARMTISINWLQYINLASNEGQQNLLVYRCQEKIYYLCYKPIPVNTELLVWYGPYIEEKKDSYRMEEVGMSAQCPPFCGKHCRNYFTEMEISHNVQNLAAVLRVKGKRTERDILSLATKEINELLRTSAKLSSDKFKEQTRYQILKKRLLFLTSLKGNNGNIFNQLGTSHIKRSILQKGQINAEHEKQQQIFSGIQQLAIMLGAEGRTGKEILDLTLLQLKHQQEVALRLQEEKRIENRKNRVLKRRFFLMSGKDLRDSSTEPSTKYCIMCEHSYSNNLS